MYAVFSLCDELLEELREERPDVSNRIASRTSRESI